MKQTFTRPCSIALIGLPGSGKTTLARGLSEQITELRIVSRDLIRDSMFKPCWYSSDEKVAAFEGMRNAQKVIWSRPESTVMDGMCFSSREVLDTVAADAMACGVGFLPFFCDCPLEVAISRVEADRRAARHLAEDRTEALVRQVNELFFRVPASIPRIDMDQDRPSVLDAVMRHLNNEDIIA